MHPTMCRRPPANASDHVQTPPRQCIRPSMQGNTKLMDIWTHGLHRHAPRRSKASGPSLQLPNVRTISSSCSLGQAGASALSVALSGPTTGDTQAAIAEQSGGVALSRALSGQKPGGTRP
eukprot:366243-Chlamydomonas_euryale.AAC.1